MGRMKLATFVLVASGCGPDGECPEAYPVVRYGMIADFQQSDTGPAVQSVFVSPDSLVITYEDGSTAEFARSEPHVGG